MTEPVSQPDVAHPEVTHAEVTSPQVPHPETPIADSPAARVGRTLDEAFAELGFVNSQRLGRKQWKGDWEGRSWTVAISQQTRTNSAGDVRYAQRTGFRVRISLSTTLRARLFLVREKFASFPLVRLIYRLRRLQVVTDLVPPLDDYQAVTSDAAWASKVLGDRRVAAAAEQLTAGSSDLLRTGSLHYGPGSIHWVSPLLQGPQITTTFVLETVDLLLELASASEAMAPPQARVLPST